MKEKMKIHHKIHDFSTNLWKGKPRHMTTN